MQLRQTSSRKEINNNISDSESDKNAEQSTAVWKSCVDRAQNLEKSFCQNFYCCGTILHSLHDLLEHFEEAHVLLENEEDQVSQSQSVPSSTATSPSVPSLVGLNAFQSPQIPSPSERFDYTDATRMFRKRQMDPYYAAFDNAIVGKKQRIDASASSSGVSASGSTSTDKQQHSTDDEFGAHSPPFAYTVAPSLLSSSEDDDQLEYEFDPEYAYYKYVKSLNSYNNSNNHNHNGHKNSDKRKIVASLNRAPPTPGATDDDAGSAVGGGCDSTATRSDRSRKNRNYQCLVPGCEKVYRNQNGLKYHVEHSHTPAEQLLCERLVRAMKEDPIEKPFGCSILGCTKRYRNSNGLKYHMLHHHG